MKDKMDILIERSLQLDFEPDREIKENILESMKHRRKKTGLLSLPRVAVVIVAGICMSSVGVYAASLVIKNVFITDHAISVGNPEYVDDAAIASPEEDVTIENVGHEEGSENVKWLSKDVQIVNGFATNTYYEYKDYETALLDAELDNWFQTSYKNAENAIYVVTQTEDTLEECIEVNFLYGEGRFHVCEERMTGNIAEDVAHSIKLKNTNNKRDYTAASGQVFTLVDEITDDGEEQKTTTFVMVAYDDYFGYISFENLKDEEIHKILDTVKVYH